MARRLLVSSMMQPAPNFCRAALFRRQSLGLCLALLPLLAAAQASDQQDLKQLEALARSEAALQFPALTERQRFLVGPIDPHTQLQKCQRPIRPVAASAVHMRDRVTIELICEEAKFWRIYVPVRIIGTSPVAVAAHAIVAGTVLKAT